MSAQPINFSQYEAPAEKPLDFSQYEEKPVTGASAKIPPKQPGILDKDIPLDSYTHATESGLQSIGRGVGDAYRGAIDTFDPRIKPGENPLLANPAGRTLRGLYQTGKQALEVPGAIRDINASPDPLGTYAKVAQDTAGEGGGQALTALATEGVGKGIGRVGKFVAENPKAAATAPVRLISRGVESAINQKLVPVKPLANIMTPADEAEAVQFKVPGRDLGLPGKPAIYPGAPLPAKPLGVELNAAQTPKTVPAAESGEALGNVKAPEPAPLNKISAAKPSAIDTSKLDTLLNDSTGGKLPTVSGKLESSVPLKEQLANSPAAKSSLPEGFTPTKSKAIQGYKYDPQTQHFEVITTGGARHGIQGISPEDFEKFENADSKGQAWNELKKSPGVIKTKNGRPRAVAKSLQSASPDDLAPGEDKNSGPAPIAKPQTANSEPIVLQQDLTPILQKSVERANARKGIARPSSTEDLHPVKIIYDEHGIPTSETDGRHRVIQAIENGDERIPVTVDRGNGPIKTTVDPKVLAREMGVTKESLRATDEQQPYRKGNLQPRSPKLVQKN